RVEAHIDGPAVIVHLERDNVLDTHVDAAGWPGFQLANPVGDGTVVVVQAERAADHVGPGVVQGQDVVDGGLGPTGSIPIDPDITDLHDRPFPCETAA